MHQNPTSYARGGNVHNPRSLRLSPSIVPNTIIVGFVLTMITIVTLAGMGVIPLP